MASLTEIRGKYPGAYDDMSDEQLADALHKKFYSDMPRDVFNQRVGLKMAGPVGPQSSPGQQDQDLANASALLHQRKQSMPYEPDPVGAAFAPQPTAGESVGGMAEARELARRNIVPGNVSPSIRAAAGFGVNDVDAYSRLLGGDTEVIRDPQSGRVIYRKRGDSVWQTVVDPRTMVDFGDVASIAGPATQVAGSTLGSIGGTAAAGPFGGIVGAGVGGTGGEFARLKMGQKFGSVDPAMQDIELLDKALVQGGIDILGAGAGAVVYRLYKTLSGRGVAGIDPDEVIRRVLELRQTRAAAGLPEPRPAQVMRGTAIGDELASAEEAVVRSGQMGREIRDMRDAENLIATQRVGGLTGETPTQPSEALGRRAVGAIEAEVRAPETSMAGTANRTIAASDVAQSQMPRGQAPEAIGDPLKQAFDKYKKELKKPISDIYEEAAAGKAGLEGVPERSIETASKYKGILEKDLYRNLSQEDRATVEAILSRYVDPEKGPLPADMETIDRALSTLRTTKRQIDRGQFTADVRMVKDLIEAAKVDRDAILTKAGRADLIPKLADADARNARFNDIYDRSFIGDALGLRSGGRDRVGDAAIGRRAVTNPDVAADIDAALPKTAPERELIREAFRHEARQRAGIVTGLPGSKVNEASYLKWIDDRETDLRRFFSQAEINRMRKPGTLAASAKQAQEAIKALKKTGDSEINSLGVDVDNPAAFFENAFKINNPASHRRIKGILDTKAPDLAKAYKGYLQARINDMTVSKGTDGRVVADAEGLRKFLSEDDGRIGVLSNWLGSDFNKRAKMLADAIETIPVKGVAQTEKAGAKAGFLAEARGIGRVIVAPLSREGRMLTNLLRYGDAAMGKRVARLLASNDDFVAAARKAQETKTGRIGAQITGMNLPEGASAAANLARYLMQEDTDDR